MTPTPRTDAIAHRGLGSVAYIAEMTDLARQLERELAVWKHESKRLEAELQKFDQAAIEWWCEYQDLKAKAGDDRAELTAERALADGLAETLANVQGDYATTGAIITQEVAESLAAWKKARETTLDK